MLPECQSGAYNIYNIPDSQCPVRNSTHDLSLPDAQRSISPKEPPSWKWLF